MNRFSKLIKTLKEAPTNSMGGVYSLNEPGFRVGIPDAPEKIYPDIDGNFTDGIPGNPGDPFYLRPEGYWNGGNNWTETEIPDASQEYLINDPTGKSTSDLIAEDGTVKTAMPPDSRSFILGPLVDGYVFNHGYDNYSNIGYIQKDTRQFVLLARIQGQFIDGLHTQGGRVWDGTAGQLTIYNSNFTLAMAEWFRDQLTANSFTENVPYFYSGGVPQQPQTPADCPNCPPNMFGGVTPGTNGGFGRGTNPTLGTQQGSSASGNQVQANIFNLTPDQQRTVMNAAMLGLDIVAVLAVLFPEPGSSAAGAAHLASKFRYIVKLRRFRGALNPFGQRAVRSGAAGRVRRQVYSGRPYQGKRGFGKTTYGTTNRATARTYSNPGPLKGTPGTGSRVNPRGTVDTGTLPQRYIDKYGSRSVLGQKQVKLGPKAAKRTFGEQPEFILEQINNYLLLETAATGSGLGGGTEVADAYVNKVSETSSPEELEKASNDANDIAKEGGKGLSDAELAKIDQDAEAEAKRLTKVPITNPEAMDDDQLFSALDSIYEMNQDWFNDTMDKLDPLIPQSELDKLREEYEEKETTRETARETIQGEIDEIDKNYNEWGGGAWTDPDGIRYNGNVNWGAQFTEQNFESSGQSFDEYNALRAQLGFFNGDSGPDEYGRYVPISWSRLFDTKENGYRPEQFSGISYEIVSTSHKLDEIRFHKNFPQPGQNIYYTEADYNEAIFLEKEYDRVWSEYINLWEGPGGFDEISRKAWDFDKRSREAWKQDARDARKRRDGLESQLNNLGGSVYDEEYEDRLNKIFRPFFITFIKEWNEFNSDLNDFETADAYDNYNWLWDNYGIDAAEWYLENQGLPMESNPFIPAGMYVPLAKAKEDPYSLAGLTPSETANMSEADKKKLKQLLQKLGIVKVDTASYKDNEKLRPQGPSTPVYYDKHMKQIVPTGNEGQILNDILKKAQNKNNNQSLVAHFEPRFLKNRERKNLTETRTPKQKRILREIKQPIKVKEAPTKYKMNFSGKFSAQNTPDKTASAQSDALVASGNAKGQKWRQQDKYWAGYETTERMNIIHDRVGHGKQAWDMILDEAKKKNGWRDKEMQEELNKIAHERAMLKENPDYTSPFGNVEVSTTEKNLQNFEKVNKIKKVVSDKKVFSNKEIKPEYPEEDKESKQRRLGTGRPPELTPDDEMIKQNRYGDMSSERGKIQKGYEHEKLNSGERASAYYKRLDPISADSMPDAAYPQIDQLRNQARNKPK